MDRRKFIQGLMAGGMVVAGELWVPGQKLISIPSGKIFTGVDLALGEDTMSFSVSGVMPGDLVRAYWIDGDGEPRDKLIGILSDEGHVIVTCGEDRYTALPGDVYSKVVPMNPTEEPKDQLDRVAYRPNQIFTRPPIEPEFEDLDA